MDMGQRLLDRNLAPASYCKVAAGVGNNCLLIERKLAMRLLPCLVLMLSVPVAAQAAATITPGMWESTSTVTAIDMPGMPPGALAAMKKPHSIRHCITPAEAAQGPRELMKRSKTCRFSRFSMVGGILDAQMECDGGGGAMTMHTHGSYTPTSFHTTGSMTMAGPRAMKMTVAGSGRLIGSCK